MPMTDLPRLKPGPNPAIRPVPEFAESGPRANLVHVGFALKQ